MSHKNALKELNKYGNVGKRFNRRKKKSFMEKSSTILRGDGKDYD